jgi:hypothetical protein
VKKSMFSLLGSLAVSALLLGYAGSAAATSFDDDSDSDRRSKSHVGGSLSDDDSDSDSDRKSKSRLKGVLGKDLAKISFFDGKGIILGKRDFARSDDFDKKLKKAKKERKLRFVKNKKDGLPGTYPKPGKDPVPAIPEPSAALIFAAGLAVAGWRRRS